MADNVSSTGEDLSAKVAAPQKSRQRTAIIVIAVLIVVCVSLWGLGREISRSLSPTQTEPGAHKADVPSNGGAEPNSAPSNLANLGSQADLQDGWQATLGEVNRKAVTKLGSQVRVNVAVVSVIIAVVVILALSAFAVYWFKFRKIEQILPIAAQPEPIPEVTHYPDDKRSLTVALSAWGLAAFFFIIVCIAQAVHTFKKNKQNEIVMYFAVSILTALTVVSLLVGLWQLGALANLTILAFFQTPATGWLIASFVAWVFSAVILLILKVKPSAQSQDNVGTIVNFSKVIIISMLFGALGAIGGGQAAICASFAAVFLIIFTLGVLLTETDLKEPIHKIIICLVFSFLICGIVAVYFRIGSGYVSFFSILISSVLIAHMGLKDNK